MAEKKAAVILSTYNGEKYIVQLLDSVRGQTYPNVSVYIRDDGSTDRTINLIRKYGKDMDICFEAGGHVGAVVSFFKLLSKVAENEEIGYICFCDQDDVWKSDKIERAVNGIKENNHCETAALYFSDYDIVNSDLEFIKRVKPAFLPCHISFENALVQNIIPGFTCVINKGAAILISENLPCAEKVVMHDWWAYLAVSALGRIVYDPESTVWYRRHENNTMDAETGKIRFWQNRLKRFLENKGYVETLAAQTEEFRRCFARKLDDEKTEVIDEFLSAVEGRFYERLQYVFNGKTYYQAWVDNVLFKLILLFEKRFKAMW